VGDKYKNVMKILPNFWGWGWGRGWDYLTTFSPPKKGNMQQNIPLYYYFFKPHLCKISYKKIWMHLACDCSYLSKQIKIFLSSSTWDRVK